MTDNTFGPNCKKLWALHLSNHALPRGVTIGDIVNFLTDPLQLSRASRFSVEWVKQAVQLVRDAPDPNPFRGASSEEIAAEILQRAEEQDDHGEGL